MNERPTEAVHQASSILADKCGQSMAPQDVHRLLALRDELSTLTIHTLLARSLSPHLSTAAIEHITGSYTLDHGALLVFSCSVNDVLTRLMNLGLTPGPVIPSVVVKGRLCIRHGLDPARSSVYLTHASFVGTDGALRRIEVFMLVQNDRSDDAIARVERRYEFERHFALRASSSDADLLQGMRWILRTLGGFAWDGGGYNPDEQPASGGMSVLYFARAEQTWSGQRLSRLEIQFPGRFPSLTNHHVSFDKQVRELYALPLRSPEAPE